jgi:hypothetical protein
MGLSKYAPRRIKGARRAIEALKLRENGLSYKEIAEKMGFSEPRAWKLVKTEFDRVIKYRTETAEHVQRLELQRLEEMFKAVYSKAKKGDFASINTALSIIDRTSKLLGLNAADKNTPLGVGNVTLNIEEVVVRKEIKKNGDYEKNGDNESRTAENENRTPPSPARISEQ